MRFVVEWIAVGVSAAVAAGAAGLWMRSRRPPDRVAGWTECFRDAASGPAALADGCELRAAGEHARWTARVPVATAPVGSLELESDRVDFEGRLYVGWDAAELPSPVAHWPELEARARRAPGDWSVRAEPDFGVERWLGDSHLDLLDLRKQSRATAVELVVSGGYVRLRLVDARPTPGLIDRAIEAADRLTGRLVAASRAGSTAGRPT